MGFNCKNYIGCNCDAQESDSVWLDIPSRSHVSPRRMQWTTKRDAQKNKNIPVHCNFSQALSNCAAPWRISQSGNWERCLTFFTRFYVSAFLIIDHARLCERKNPIFFGNKSPLHYWESLRQSRISVPAIQIDINIEIKTFWNCSFIYTFIYYCEKQLYMVCIFVGIVNLMLLSS